MRTLLKHKFWQRYILICGMLLLLCRMVSAQASSEIDVGLVVSQFSAELIASGSFSAVEPSGKKTVLEKGKYFIAVKDGKISVGDRLLENGTVLKNAEPADNHTEND